MTRMIAPPHKGKDGSEGHHSCICWLTETVPSYFIPASAQQLPYSYRWMSGNQMAVNQATRKKKQTNKAQQRKKHMKTNPQNPQPNKPKPKKTQIKQNHYTLAFRIWGRWHKPSNHPQQHVLTLIQNSRAMLHSVERIRKSEGIAINWQVKQGRNLGCWLLQQHELSTPLQVNRIKTYSSNLN